MKKIIKLLMLLGMSLFINASLTARNKDNPLRHPKTEKTMKVALIDRITVPVASKEEFIKRMNANIEILKKQKGFIKHDTYEQQAENDNFIFVTVVEWKDLESVNNAKVAVEAEYRRIGFNLKEFCQKNNITLERNGIYRFLEN